MRIQTPVLSVSVHMNFRARNYLAHFLASPGGVANNQPHPPPPLQPFYLHEREASHARGRCLDDLLKQQGVLEDSLDRFEQVSTEREKVTETLLAGLQTGWAWHKISSEVCTVEPPNKGNLGTVR